MITMLKLSILVLSISAISMVHAEQYTKSQITLQSTIEVVDDSFLQSPADTGINGAILTIANFGNELIVGGKFFSLAGVVASRIGGWDGSTWHAMSSIPSGAEVYSLHEFEGELYAGSFLPTLLKWTGAAWTSVGPDLAPQIDYGKIYAMETFNSELVVAGGFAYDTLQPPYIAKWNGTTWDSLAYGVIGTVYDLQLYNGELVAGGRFNDVLSAGTEIASWNGSSWSALGSGINATTGNNNPAVHAMVVYQSDLIAAGDFEEAGGNSAINISRWNGTYWQRLNGTLNNTVYDLIVYNGELIAAGAFVNSGVQNASYIAKWNGADWVSIGLMDDTVRTLDIYNGKLVAGGVFTSAGGGHIAWWDSTTTTWRPISDIVTDISDDVHRQLPSEFSLNQNYPNPFNPTTTISFELHTKMKIRIDIYNIQGQVVTTLVDSEKPAGHHQVIWDGKSMHGEQAASGMYYYQLTTENYKDSKKMLLLK